METNRITREIFAVYDDPETRIIGILSPANRPQIDHSSDFVRLRPNEIITPIQEKLASYLCNQLNQYVDRLLPDRNLSVFPAVYIDRYEHSGFPAFTALVINGEPSETDNQKLRTFFWRVASPMSKQKSLTDVNLPEQSPAPHEEEFTAQCREELKDSFSGKKVPMPFVIQAGFGVEAPVLRVSGELPRAEYDMPPAERVEFTGRCTGFEERCFSIFLLVNDFETGKPIRLTLTGAEAHHFETLCRARLERKSLHAVVLKTYNPGNSRPTLVLESLDIVATEECFQLAPTGLPEG